jgi:phosphogluconate dehydratase
MKNPIIELSEKIKEKSRPTRSAYLKRIKAMIEREKGADRLGCANVAHAFASSIE